MTKVSYLFPWKLFYQNEAIRAVNKTMEGFGFSGRDNPLSRLGLVGEAGGFTISYERDDGKGLTEDENLAMVKIFQDEIDRMKKESPKAFEAFEITVLKGVRQDEPNKQKIAPRKPRNSKKLINRPAINSGNRDNTKTN
jgi:hypothetical protein